MNLVQIAWRNFCHRLLSSLLTTLSLTLGVALVVTVVSIYGVIKEAFQNNVSVGYNLVVGPPGSDLQITLNSVYYLSQPVENLPYTYYMEFMDADERARQVEAFGGNKTLGEDEGEYHQSLGGEGYAIPLALGDYLGKFRLVGTTPDFFEKLRYGENVDQPFEFREGRAFQTKSDEHGYFEAVLGHRVAKEMEIKVGDIVNPKHGDPEGKDHKEGFTVVGILAPSGTPQDRAAFVNLEGFYLMDGHANDVDEGEETSPVAMANQAARDRGDYDALMPLTIPEREVTAILVKSNFLDGPGLQNGINESRQARAAAPIGEITKLMEMIVGPMVFVLLVITSVTCVVAAVGVLVAIYNSMNDRKRDIAVMRALGARRDTVTMIIIFESLLIAVIGGIAGWLIAHAAIFAFRSVIEDQTGVTVGFFTVSIAELYILPVVLLLAAIAALLPAFAAYRTDVGSNLS